ncbi:MAG: hypothetical protein ACLSFT_00755 [Ruminococcus callidus]
MLPVVKRGKLNVNEPVEIGLSEEKLNTVTGLEMFRKSLDFANWR